MSDVLDTLFETIQDRQANPRPGSYTASLLEVFYKKHLIFPSEIDAALQTKPDKKDK